MSQMFERLKEERERLRMSQEGFGVLGGVTKRTQAYYESGERTPDATYLAGIAGGGVDVNYVITGERGQQERQVSQPTEGAASAQAFSKAGRTTAYVEQRELNVYALPAQPSGMTEKEVCSLIIDILHAKRRTLPSTTVWAIVDSIMALQRGGISVDKSTIDTQLQLVK